MYAIANAKKSTLIRFVVDINAVDEYGVMDIKDMGPRTKYPFEALTIGQCFIVPMKDVKYNTLRSAAAGAHWGKRFQVVPHPDKHVYEVVRVK